MAKTILNCYNNYTVDSFQTSPSWVVTFVRFEERLFYDYSNYGETDSARALSSKEPPLVVINDCINLTVSQSKSSHNQNCSLTLLGGEVNYSAAIAPGDYFTVNIVNSEEKANSIFRRARESKQINTQSDGFKGLFKVQSVHQTVQISGNGTKQVRYQVTGYSFSELDNVIYFNPNLLNAGIKDNDLFFLSMISGKWNTLIKDKLVSSVQDVMLALYSTFVGDGFSRGSVNQQFKTENAKLKTTESNLYKIPSQVARLLGVPGGKYSADIIDVYAGVQEYKNYNEKEDHKKSSPDVSKVTNMTIYTTPSPLKGATYAKPEYWNQIKVWDIMAQYLNPVVNEMYTTFRLSPGTINNQPSVMPALVMREKPFTTPNIKKEGYSKTVTMFHSLPRWQMPGEAVFSSHIGRDDASRVNMVQVFGRTQAFNKDANVDFQMAQGNYTVDRNDIIRSGLRPYIVTSNFDDIKDKKSFDSIYWSKLVSNWVMGSHLKMSGTISCIGIEKAIPVGDNLEYEGFLFHIEGISHSCSISGNGRKTFRTTLNLTNGLNHAETDTNARFSEMSHSDADSYRLKFVRQGQQSSLLPGVSDVQDRPDSKTRTRGEKVSSETDLVKSKTEKK